MAGPPSTPSREGFETVFMRKNGERFPVMILESPLVDVRLLRGRGFSAAAATIFRLVCSPVVIRRREGLSSGIVVGRGRLNDGRASHGVTMSLSFSPPRAVSGSRC